MARPIRRRPTLADIQQDGPALTPADLGLLIGLPREIVASMCRHGEIAAVETNAGHPRRRRWRIARAVARELCAKMGIRPFAA